MHPDTHYLKTIAEEIAANPGQGDTVKPNHHLERAALELEKAIVQSLQSIENFTQRDTYHFNTLSRLVNICDTLYNIHGRITPDVVAIMELLQNVRQILPSEIRATLKLAKAFVMIQQAVFEENWSLHLQELERQSIDPELIVIAAVPFQRFRLSKYKLYWGDYAWLKSYLSKLDMIDWEHNDCNSKTEALMSLMIGREFNDDRFYVYCKKYIEAKEKAAADKRERIEVLVACEKLVLQDTQTGIPSFDHHANRVSTRLIKWIHEEIEFVETHEKEKTYARLQFDWTVEMIAIFLKLLHERKIFGNIKLERFSEVIAANCTTMDREEIQASTVYSRFYKKDMELLKAVRKMLKDILDDLDNLIG